MFIVGIRLFLRKEVLAFTMLDRQIGIGPILSFPALASDVVQRRCTVLSR